MTPDTSLPEIDINVAAGAWPDAADLEVLVTRAVEATVATAGLAYPEGAELSILCTDDAGIHEINRQWRGFDKPTNVLSFPGEDIAPGEAAGPMLGDIVLSLDTIAREATLEGKPFDHHLTHMIVHGLLHLFGYDHMNDDEAGVMEGLETATLASLGMDDPYAA